MSAREDLWSFSLRVYGAEPVAASCLWLQDHRAVDVSLLLYCCWLGARGSVLAPPVLAAAQHAVSPWTREVVAPLRSARRWMKTQLPAAPESRNDGRSALRERIKAAELEAERLAQRMLERTAPPADESATRLDGRLALMAENTTRYLASIGVTIDPEVAERLAVVLGSASRAGPEDAAAELSRRIRTRRGARD